MVRRRGTVALFRAALLAGSVVAVSAALATAARADTQTLLNVSYDPTRELYKAVDARFEALWSAQGKGSLSIKSSHGGSGAQARAVLDGLQADVVTLGIASDIDALAQRGLLSRDWATRLPNHAVPYTSRIVFLVRAGNQKSIRDWPDLIRPGVQVITPNPKTSSGGRWNYIAAYLWALNRPGGSEASARTYLQALYGHVPVLDTGARGSTTSFMRRGEGDVLVAWEDEALLAAHVLEPGKFEVVYPSTSVIAEPPVAVVDSVAKARGTTALAEAYLRFLYSPEGQQIEAEHFYRPIDPSVAARYRAQFPEVKAYTVESIGGWSVLQPKHFGEGGVFDTIHPRAG